MLNKAISPINDEVSTDIYLQDRAEYERRYDLLTIEGAKWIVQSMKDKINDEKDINKLHKLYLMRELVIKIRLYYYNGAKYLEREPTIQEWIERDKNKDAILQNAAIPSNIRCNACHNNMRPDSKMFDIEEDTTRVMFVFLCEKGCGQKKVIYDDGTEWESPRSKCPDCKIKLIHHTKRIKDKIIIADNCPTCSYVRNDELDMRKRKEEIYPNFEECRKLYCLSKKEGEEYRKATVQIDMMSQLVKEMTEREKNKDIYDAIKKLKKFTVTDLEKHLLKPLNDRHYIRLVLDKPEIGSTITIPFTVQDTSDRDNKTSEIQLKTVIKKALENTNWKLMAEGVTYRLGYLYGRLRGFENEEDLISIVKKSI